MIFLSIFIVLFIQHFKLLSLKNPASKILQLISDYVKEGFKKGKLNNGLMAWVLINIIFILIFLFILWISGLLGFLVKFIFLTSVIYLLIGYFQFNTFFENIKIELSNGNINEAGKILSEWAEEDLNIIEKDKIIKITIEKSILSIHRHVFGIFFWLLMPLGPFFAILYRVTDFVSRKWDSDNKLGNESFGYFANEAFYWLDWIPVRITLLSFAFVGNFEKTIHHWKNFYSNFKNNSSSLILGGGEAAMGIKFQEKNSNNQELHLKNKFKEENLFKGARDNTEEKYLSIFLLDQVLRFINRAIFLWVIILFLISIIFFVY